VTAIFLYKRWKFLPASLCIRFVVMVLPKFRRSFSFSLEEPISKKERFTRRADLPTAYAWR